MPPASSQMYYSHSSRSKAQASSTSSPSLYLARKKRDTVKHSDSSKSSDKDLFVNNNQRRSALSRSSSKSSVPCEAQRSFEEETCESGQMVRPSLEVIDKVYGKQDPSTLLTCDECKYTTESEIRFKLHFDEPRHVNHFRSMAYREPKKRQLWLKIWFSTLEKAEAKNGDAFELDEEEEDEFEMMTEMAESAASKKFENKNKKTGFGL